MKIPLYRSFTDEEDIERVTAVLRRGSDWAIGPEVAEFESAVARYVGRKYGVSFNSGTSALHAAMLALRVGAGQKVVVPSFTFIATANAALFVGATPEFADIEDVTYGLDPESAEAAMGKKTTAMVPAHIGGVVCKSAEELERIAKKRKVAMIEDACEALGSRADERNAGTYGDASVLSFCANKVISTGEGGMVLTDDLKTYERLSLVKSHGRLDKTPYFTTTNPPDYVGLGYNWRISSMTAALGLAQLAKLDKAVDGRRRVAGWITRGLAKVREVTPPLEPSGYKHTYQMYTLRVKSGAKERDGLRDHLKKEGVFSKVYFDPIHKSRFYKGRPEAKRARLPVTDRVSGQVLTVPVFPTMAREEADYLAGSIAEYFER